MTTSRGDEGILLRRCPLKTVPEDTRRFLHTPSSSGLTRGSKHKPSTSDGHARSPHFPKKGGRSAAISQQNQTATHFFIPAHFSSRRLTPVPPSDTPDDAMSGEAGPAPGRSTVAGASPRPAATVSLRTWGWNEGVAVGCRQTWIPRSEGRASEAHRQGANAVANIQTAGRTKRRG